MSSFNLIWVIILFLVIILLIGWYNEFLKKDNDVVQPIYKVTFGLEVKNPKTKEPHYYEIIYDIPINISDEDFIIFKAEVLKQVSKSANNDYDRKMLEQEVSNQLDTLIERLRKGRVK